MGSYNGGWDHDNSNPRASDFGDARLGSRSMLKLSFQLFVPGNQGCYPTMFGSIQGIQRAKVENGAQESVPKEDFEKLEGVYPGGFHLKSVKCIVLDKNH